MRWLDAGPSTGPRPGWTQGNRSRAKGQAAHEMHAPPKDCRSPQGRFPIGMRIDPWTTCLRGVEIRSASAMVIEDHFPHATRSDLAWVEGARFGGEHATRRGPDSPTRYAVISPGPFTGMSWVCNVERRHRQTSAASARDTGLTLRSRPVRPFRASHLAMARRASPPPTLRSQHNGRHSTALHWALRDRIFERATLCRPSEFEFQDRCT